MFDLTEDIFYWFSEPDKLHYGICIFIIFFVMQPLFQMYSYMVAIYKYIQAFIRLYCWYNCYYVSLRIPWLVFYL